MLRAQIWKGLVGLGLLKRAQGEGEEVCSAASLTQICVKAEASGFAVFPSRRKSTIARGNKKCIECWKCASQVNQATIFSDLEACAT